MKLVEVRRGRLIADRRIVLRLRRIFSLSIFGPYLTSTIGTSTLFVSPSTMVFGPTTLQTNSSPNRFGLINTHLKYPKIIMKRSKTACKRSRDIGGQGCEVREIGDGAEQEQR